jgi:RNA polymerase sigma-70 factor (ECF subfamily)
MMRSTKAGDVEFERFFRSSYARAFGVALRVLGNPTEAEDAAAEAFSRALVRWRRVRTLDYREAWVLRVAANVAIDTVRRRRGQAPGRATDVIDEPQAETVERLALLGALHGLPARQRDVLVLRYFGDLSDEDIGRCLSMANGTVKAHLSRGLQHLRRRFDVDGKEVPVAFDGP